MTGQKKLGRKVFHGVVCGILALSAGLLLPFAYLFVLGVRGMYQSGSYGFGPWWAAGFAALVGLCGVISVLASNQAYRLLLPGNTESPRGRINWFGVGFQVVAITILIATKVTY